MSNEDEIRKLLKFRNDLELNLLKLSKELDDTKKVLAQIEKLIVQQGFKQPKTIKDIKVVTDPELILEKVGASSIQAKDGTILGNMEIDEKQIIFYPKQEFQFSTNIAPYQSFLIDRVLNNMKTTDEQKATNGELEIDDVLNYSVDLDNEIIKSITVRNYGGERRLREIQSSLRWSFDKMYDKIRRG
ncbi:hypothetical protein FJY84_06970 [Candidatus Bathyarchaeota archaeon]|nr:hypothetical protein [Candidatus Bathyarchaeota archaeon]